jgi:hypothetical protein
MKELEECDSLECATIVANEMDGLPSSWVFSNDTSIASAVSGSFPI